MTSVSLFIMSVTKFTLARDMFFPTEGFFFAQLYYMFTGNKLIVVPFVMLNKLPISVLSIMQTVHLEEKKK